MSGNQTEVEACQRPEDRHLFQGCSFQVCLSVTKRYVCPSSFRESSASVQSLF